MRVKVDGAWTRAKNLFVKPAGTWTRGNIVWEKVAGVWVTRYQSIPNNMVILYTNTNYDGYVCNGSNGTPNLLDKFVRGGATPLSVGGNTSHDASAHGAGTATTSANAHSKTTQSTWVFPSGYGTTWSSHTHTVASHTHSGSNSNLTCGYRSFIPTIFSTSIKAGAFFPSISNITGDWISAYTQELFLYLSSTAATVAPSTHQHDAYTIDTNLVNVNGTKDYYLNPNPQSWVVSHRHTANHSLSTAQLDPLHRKVLPYIYQGSDIYNLKALPSGVIGFFTTPSLPVGWSRYALLDGRLVKLGSVVADGGDNTHGHTSTTVTTGGISNTTYISADYESGSDYRVGSHTHTFTDSHTGTTDITPPYVNLVIGVKD